MQSVAGGGGEICGIYDWQHHCGEGSAGEDGEILLVPQQVQQCNCNLWSLQRTENERKGQETGQKWENLVYR